MRPWLPTRATRAPGRSSVGALLSGPRPAMCAEVSRTAAPAGSISSPPGRRRRRASRSVMSRRSPRRGSRGGARTAVSRMGARRHSTCWRVRAHEPARIRVGVQDPEGGEARPPAAAARSPDVHARRSWHVQGATIVARTGARSAVSSAAPRIVSRACRIPTFRRPLTVRKAVIRRSRVYYAMLCCEVLSSAIGRMATLHIQPGLIDTVKLGLTVYFPHLAR